jgi:hypothetical protein
MTPGEALCRRLLKLEKAWDITWLYGNLGTLHRWDLRGHIPVLLSDFSQAHYFPVWLDNVLSARYLQENCEPQGWTLSATVFAISTNGMVKAAGPSLGTSLYVHDVAICYSIRSNVTTAHRLQGAVNLLSRWVQSGFYISADKTIVCMSSFGGSTSSLPVSE